MRVTETAESYVIRNENAVFTVGKNGSALSLKLTAFDEELLCDSNTPLFTVTQDRFFDNELKLMHTAREVTAVSTGLRYKNGKFTVSFDTVPYEAVIDIEDKGSYFVFTLNDFLFPEDVYKWLYIEKPPATKFRFLQLHLKERKYFGEWMNVCHDDKACVAVMGTTPKAIIGSKKTEKGYLLFSEACKGILFKGCSCILSACKKDDFLDITEKFENDFNLPQGVKSRRCDKINASAYWVWDATPFNIDEHIENALKGGFSQMLMYYTCFVKEQGSYRLCGNYELREEYKNGLSDIKDMIKKIEARGISAGLHFLHSHIGLDSCYFTPEADRRVMHRQLFTLSQGIDEYETEIFVDQYPYEAELPEKCRILRIGTELIHYDSCSDTYPYCYSGCKRGYNGTSPQKHPVGTGGGVVFISEFGASSGYCDQNSSLQDEIAEKIARIYNQGFRFIYMDGSEGVNAPYEYQLPFAQQRVYDKLIPPPIYCEASAKGHFSWHILSGGNAFDIFPTDIFKAMINKYPLFEAPNMKMDFTRLNFGWWGYFKDSRPDVFEYGASHAAGFDCPVTIQSNLVTIRENKRSRDNLEVLKRWEDARKYKLLTEEQKKMIRTPGREFTLIKDFKGEYELTEYFEIKTPVKDITVFRFTRKGKNILMLCHNTDECKIFIPTQLLRISDEIEGKSINIEFTENGTLIPVSDRCYLETELSVKKLEEVLSEIRKI